VEKYQPDILCLQETKAEQHQSEVDLPEYEEYWNSASKKDTLARQYLQKTKPLSISNGFTEKIAGKFGLIADVYGDPQTEGRVITAEFKRFLCCHRIHPKRQR